MIFFLFPKGCDTLQVMQTEVEREFCPQNGYEHQAKVIWRDSDSVMIDFGVDTAKEANRLSLIAEERCNRIFQTGTSWADISAAEEEEQTEPEEKEEDFEDQLSLQCILYFTDNWDYGELRFSSIVADQPALMKLVQQDPNLIYFHGFRALDKRIFYGKRKTIHDPVKLRSLVAPAVYLNNLQKFVPVKIWQWMQTLANPSNLIVFAPRGRRARTKSTKTLAPTVSSSQKIAVNNRFAFFEEDE